MVSNCRLIEAELLNEKHDTVAGIITKRSCKSGTIRTKGTNGRGDYDFLNNAAMTTDQWNFRAPF